MESSRLLLSNWPRAHPNPEGESSGTMGRFPELGVVKRPPI